MNIVRIFEDDDYVFAHTEYDFDSSNVGFEIFRFEGDQAVEHWDNIQQRQGPNPSGHSMVDGETEVKELEKTESNREIIRAFIDDVLIKRDTEKIYDYIKWNHFIEHNPQSNDELEALIKIVSPASIDALESITYEKCHRILAEGNFVLGFGRDSSYHYYMSEPVIANDPFMYKVNGPGGSVGTGGRGDPRGRGTRRAQHQRQMRFHPPRGGGGEGS